ncbi:hypothetical protein niasHS_010659 [Heterodera schachtii]|uniref:Uncharacterized protein n=1 Tax=Heterodera schachtii TaxID=97005 RepID=A0ABD2IUQ2_HETSC
MGMEREERTDLREKRTDLRGFEEGRQLAKVVRRGARIGVTGRANWLHPSLLDARKQLFPSHQRSSDLSSTVTTKKVMNEFLLILRQFRENDENEKGDGGRIGGGMAREGNGGRKGERGRENEGEGGKGGGEEGK